MTKKQHKTKYRRFNVRNTHGMIAAGWTDEQLDRFVSTIDTMVSNSTPIKTDVTSTVCKAEFDSSQIVIKRYNNKGFSHSLRNSLRPSRAYKSWYKSCLLLDLGIFTPKPLGYIVEKQNGLYYRSYFIMEFCPAPTFDNILLQTQPSESELQQIRGNIKKMLDQFATNKITHGDLKQSNILVTDNSVGVIDLDAMVIHKNPFTYRTKRKKDELTFTQRLQETPAQYAERMKKNFNIG